MKKGMLFAALLILLIFLFMLASCKSNEVENDVLEEIRSAPVVKLESATHPDNEPIFIDNTGTSTSIADARIQVGSEDFSEEWIYRFTYNPKEKVIDGHEIAILFGATSMEIDGVPYTTEEGVEYSSILDWAEGVYGYYEE